MKKLERQIEDLRNKLDEMLSDRCEKDRNEILKASRQLDSLIVKYIKMNLLENNNKNKIN